MSMLKQQIASRLEVAFSQYGFAEASVAQLKNASEVSLRTLYKHYPSKEEMIVGALEHRHQRYLDFLLDGSPEKGLDAVLHIFEKLDHWMAEFAPHGCLSINAISAYPDNLEINQAVHKHKLEVRELLGEQSGKPELATALFLIHEGVSNAWPVLGKEASDSAKQTLIQLLEK